MAFAGNDITVRGSNLDARDQLSLSAARDVRIESAQDSASCSHFAASSKKGFTGSLADGIGYRSVSNNEVRSDAATTQVGSTLSGKNVGIDAGRDIQVSASNVLADKDITFSAGRNIDILAAQDTESASTARTHRDRGIGLAPGLAPRQTTYSHVRGTEDGNGQSSTAVTSLVSANGGNLTMAAGLDAQYADTDQGNVRTEGADLLAKDKVTLTGNAVDLGAATSSGSSTHSARVKTHTIGAQLSGTVGSLITRAYDMAKESDRTEDSRLKGALQLKAGYDAYKLVTDGALKNGIKGLTDSGTGGDPAGSVFGVSVSEQRSTQRSTSAETFTNRRGTNIQAGSIDITARETDIRAEGAKLQAQDISLDAKRHIDLGAAQNIAATVSRNSGHSFGGGVTFGFGSQNGISFQANAGSNKGRSDGSEVRYDNTLVTATNSLKLKSGGNTTLAGAQLAGDSVKLDVGGDLKIQTLQDQTRYASKQSSSGLDVSICVPPICYGQLVTATANYARQKVDHNYRSATGQSGIAAGAGGYDIDVKGGTTLEAAAITSQAEADKNRLATASLTFSDLENRQSTNSSSDSLSLSYSSGGYGAAADAGKALANSATRSVTNTVLSNLNAGKGLPGDNQQASQTLSNTLTLQQAQEIPKLQEQAQNHQRAAQLVGSLINQIIGDVAAKQGWKEGSWQRLRCTAYLRSCSRRSARRQCACRGSGRGLQRGAPAPDGGKPR